MGTHFSMSHSRDETKKYITVQVIRVLLRFIICRTIKCQKLDISKKIDLKSFDINTCLHNVSVHCGIFLDVFNVPNSKTYL